MRGTGRYEGGSPQQAAVVRGMGGEGKEHQVGIATSNPTGQRVATRSSLSEGSSIRSCRQLKARRKAKQLRTACKFGRYPISYSHKSPKA